MGYETERIEIMAATKGNQFWKARSKHGRDKIFTTPEILWEACCEYFQWVEDNPLVEGKLFSYEGHVHTGELNKMRAMTIGGLSTFLDINQSTWFEYAKNKDFTNITTRVDQIIRDQKFAGASAGMLNPNIIARDLGLSDKQELTGADGGPIKYADMTDDQLIQRAKALMAQSDD